MCYDYEFRFNFLSGIVRPFKILIYPSVHPQTKKVLKMSLCNATKQELINAGLNVLQNCTVDGCGLPVARHRDEGQQILAG